MVGGMPVTIYKTLNVQISVLIYPSLEQGEASGVVTLLKLAYSHIFPLITHAPLNCDKAAPDFHDQPAVSLPSLLSLITGHWQEVEEAHILLSVSTSLHVEERILLSILSNQREIM